MDRVQVNNSDYCFLLSIHSLLPFLEYLVGICFTLFWMINWFSEQEIIQTILSFLINNSINSLYIVRPFRMFRL